MGQYYKILNIDKKEMLVPWSWNNGAKLMEWSYCGNSMVRGFLTLLYNSWKGDRVYVVGDYAVTYTEDEIDEAVQKTCKSFTQLLEEDNELSYYDTLVEAIKFLGINNGETLYSFASENFEEITSDDIDNINTDITYIYNHTTKQFINLNNIPVSRYSLKIFPLTLLLAMGNGKGGGDYFGEESIQYVGTWCSSSSSIEVSSDFIDYGYEEFNPDFIE